MHWDGLEHPPYRPDLFVTLIIFLVCALERCISIRLFDNDQYVEDCLHNWVMTQSPSSYKQGIHKLPNRRRKCVEHGKEYSDFFSFFQVQKSTDELEDQIGSRLGVGQLYRFQTSCGNILLTYSGILLNVRREK